MTQLEWNMGLLFMVFGVGPVFLALWLVVTAYEARPRYLRNRGRRGRRGRFWQH